MIIWYRNPYISIRKRRIVGKGEQLRGKWLQTHRRGYGRIEAVLREGG